MGVTPQSIGQWIRRERHAESRFPSAYILADGGLWLWAEVVTALASRGEEVEQIGYPHRRDIQVIGGVLAAHAIATEYGWTWRSHATADEFTTNQSKSIQQITPVENASFGLAALRIGFRTYDYNVQTTINRVSRRPRSTSIAHWF